MSNNKSYRIRTEVGSTNNNVLNVQIDSDYDILEILSLKFETENMYKLHTSKYGCVVGRVLANGGVGVPNAKISIFIEADEETIADDILYNIYPYTTTSDKNSDGIRYNLLPDEQVSQCHQVVGTMPNKRLVLDDKNTLEIFDKYYKYTTVTNGAGDYMIMGVPVGNQTLHMDVDLSDIGFLSQKPVDMVYKGYNITQFENPSMFKKDTNLNNLTQIISQDTTVYVNPFWGDENLGETISITRHDIDVNYKFEPTCIFMGSIATETSSNGFSKKCVPTPKMGRMDELKTGSGTIEMIRLRPDGEIESYNVNGSELIDGDGVWCYQIPMNLDYITTDEYGNIIPTDNPEKGIATRTKVRFRVSISDFESDYSNNHFVKVLVPNNPDVKTYQDANGNDYQDLRPDYTFGTDTNKEDSFRDLFWNNVYTVKSFIPRIQKGNYQRTKKFSGIKNVNVHGKNNPMPYNNMRVNITFMFILQCAIIKTLIWVIKVYNKFLYMISAIDSVGKHLRGTSCLYLGDGVCPDLDGWYFAPGCGNRTNNPSYADVYFRDYTMDKIKDVDSAGTKVDPKSTDAENSDDEAFCVSWGDKPNYLMQCIEINLAMENEVIQFDFYNDWINGLIYIPRWFVKITKKAKLFFGLIRLNPKVKACDDGFDDKRRYVQQCAMEYGKYGSDKNNDVMYTRNITPNGCHDGILKTQKCHKTKGRKYVNIFGSKRGIVHAEENKRVTVEVKGEIKSQKAYYAKPSEHMGGWKKCNLFATDIVLLGSINPNNLWGIPSEFGGLTSSTFQMPPNLVQSNTDTDGAMYAVDGARTCVGGQKNSKGGKEVKRIEEYTPEVFNKWVAGTEEVNNDNLTEYAVTEIVGIDWGISGPKQGGNNKDALYYPGGHFLGIACISSAVNIKSCVNLTRICEIGALMSQRQENFKKNENDIKNIDYEYIIPSGLISKYENSESNYRNIFATLNHNRLKLLNSEGSDTIKGYEFISVQPNNFNGELHDKVFVIGPYNNVIEEGDSVEKHNAYVRTYELTSKDYYNFRLGLHDNTDANVRRKYLKTGDAVSLPVYENSFYFYFGMVDGSTAIDKFLTEYYSPCTVERIEEKPSIKVVKCEDAIVCNVRGAVHLEVNNIPDPYSYTLVKDGSEFISDFSEGINLGKDIYIGMNEDNEPIIDNGRYVGLEKGNYTMIVKNETHDISAMVNFTINEYLPDSNEYNLNKDSVDIVFGNYAFEPRVNFKSMWEGNDRRDVVDLDVEATFEGDIENSIVFNKIKTYDDTVYDGKNRLKPPYIVGISIDDGIYYSYRTLINASDGTIKKIENEIKKILDETYIEIRDFNVGYAGKNKINLNEGNGLFEIIGKNGVVDTIENGVEYYGNIFNWGEGKYSIKVFYSCKTINTNDKEIDNNIEISYYEKYDDIMVESKLNKFEFWIHDENADLNYFDKCLKIKGNTIEIDVDLIKEINSPQDEWKIKKELLYEKSLYNLGELSNGFKVKVGTTNGTKPINEYVEGNSETLREDYLILIGGVTNDVNLNNIMAPNNAWMSEKDFDDKINFEENINNKINYRYYAIDGDDFQCLYGKLTPFISSTEYEKLKYNVDEEGVDETEWSILQGVQKTKYYQDGYVPTTSQGDCLSDGCGEHVPCDLDDCDFDFCEFDDCESE